MLKADVSEWKIEEGGNGHFYEVVYVGSSGISWTDANSEAIVAGGYLVTITSKEENDFVYSLISSNNDLWAPWNDNGLGPWLGGFQNKEAYDVDEGWTWITGEVWSYTNWSPTTPDDYHGVNEDKLHFFSSHSLMNDSAWNDNPDKVEDSGTPIRAYIVEFDDYKDFCSQKTLDAQYEAGKQFCIDNPVECGWTGGEGYTKADLDTKYQEGFTAGKNSICDTSNQPPVSDDNCAAFDIFTNTLHVPCFNAGSSTYWLDWELTGSDPVSLKLKDIGNN